MWGSAVRVRPGLLPGGLAQLARAPALQAGGQGFDSLALHTPALEAGGIFDRMEGKTQTNLRTLKHKKVQFTWKNQKQERGYSEKAPRREAAGLAPVRDKYRRAHGGCLGSRRRRRTRQAAKSRGEARTAYDPRVSEWGNPSSGRLDNLMKVANPPN